MTQRVASEGAFHRKTVIGVMGGGDVEDSVIELAVELGGRIADRGWTLLNGGRACGVMEGCTRGAKQSGGMVIGILPSRDTTGSIAELDIAIVTGMGDARNLINVLTSDVVIALRGGAGTVSEVALALKNDTHVILLDFDLLDTFPAHRDSGMLRLVSTAEEAVRLAASLLTL